MPNYRSLIPGGYFSSPAEKGKVNASIWSNNPGAINGNAQWVQDSPGFVTTVVIGGGNPIAVFETPEQGVALWLNLMKRYQAGGYKTLQQIINRYGGGQDYSAYVKFVADKTGFSTSKVIDLSDDGVLLPFFRAMIHYEAGGPSPLSDAQIHYGFDLARGGKAHLPEPDIPPWLVTMREITGTDEYPGGADNPVIMGWRDEIARRYPDMAEYCRQYTHDAIPWCGLTVAYCMAANGIRPVFGPTDTDKFLRADAWRKPYWEMKVLDQPRLGCVMVFTRNGGGHVSLYESEETGYYLVRGGNQADSVNVTRISKNQFTAALWPEQTNSNAVSAGAAGAIVVAGGAVAAEAHNELASPWLIGLIVLATIAGSVGAWFAIKKWRST